MFILQIFGSSGFFRDMPFFPQPVQQPVAQPVVQQPLQQPTAPRTYTPGLGMTLLPTDVIPIQMVGTVARDAWRLVFGN